MHHRRSGLMFATAAICFAVSLPGAAQSRATVTVADYERAEKFLNYNTNPLVTNGAVRANWMSDDRFWYRNQTANGHEFILVDAAKATKLPAFDHAAVAKTLTTIMGKPVTAERFPFQQITFSADVQSFWFDSDLKRWTCDVRGQHCAGVDRPAPLANSVLSPDGKLAAFLRDYN